VAARCGARPAGPLLVLRRAHIAAAGGGRGRRRIGGADPGRGGHGLHRAADRVDRHERLRHGRRLWDGPGEFPALRGGAVSRLQHRAGPDDRRGGGDGRGRHCRRAVDSNPSRSERRGIRRPRQRGAGPVPAPARAAVHRRTSRPGRGQADAPAGRAAAGQGRLDLHLRPVGQRVPAGARGRLPAARPGAGLSSIYHVGLQLGRWGKNQELDVLSQAMYHARELAMSRMEAEARRARRGRHRRRAARRGDEGVRRGHRRVHRGRHRGQGRAGAGGGGRGQLAQQQGQPFTSDLSGQDFWTLIRAGYAPLGMVMGSCVYHIAHQRMGPGARQHRPQRGDRAVHPGPVRRPRAGHEPDAGRGRGTARRGHRRRPAAPAQPHLGLAHHRVLRDRHGGPPAAPRPRHREIDEPFHRSQQG
jgi:hypothetical protein